MSLFRRVRDTFRPDRIDTEIDREFQFHFEQRVDDLIAAGATPEEARRQAARLFGNRAHLRESTRDRDLLEPLRSLLQDLRFAARNLRRSPGFTAVAVLSLAFGIGVNASIFTMVHGILLQRLPVPDPSRIVQVDGHIKSFDNSSFSFPVFRELARQDSIFADLIAFRNAPVQIDFDGRDHTASLEMVSGGYFRFFGARPALGRLLDESDERTDGARPVCVLSYNAWQSLFGGDPAVLRRPLSIRGIALQIVGVAPPGFTGAELQSQYDLFVPTAESNDLVGIPRQSANYIWLRMLGRIPRAMSRAEASARLEAASQAIEDALPKNRANKGTTFSLVDASKGFGNWRTPLRDPLVILMGAVSLVLLVACANLANLLLARAAERRQEFAIKLAIGIGRGRLLRQLLVETALLAACGGALALMLSSVLTRLLLALFNAGEDYAVLNVSASSAVLLFTFGACVATILLAGVYPSWRASRMDAGPGLKGSTMADHGTMRRSLILVQVSLAVVLLFGASLFTHSLRNLKTIDLGYRIDRVLTVNLGPKGTLKGPRVAFSAQVDGEILDRARHLPGVEAAAFASPGILSGGMIGASITLPDAAGGSRDFSGTHGVKVSPGFFLTLRMRLLRGRDFTAADGASAPPVAIVNRRLAALAWPGQDALGKHFDGWGGKNVEVIGVTADSRDQDVRASVEPTVYLPLDQQRISGASLELRCTAPLPAVETAVREIVKTAAPGYRVSRAIGMELLRDNQIHQERLLAFLSSLFGALGTSLALVGIYGLIAYSVRRRTREIGIRISVGAQNRDVLWLFLRESALLLGAGLILGLSLALLLSRFVGKLLFQVPRLDAPAMAATVALLAIGGVAASVLPAHAATRVSPIEALRED
ncbi:MAG: ABC transporter permease [Candidatus Sulfopaludibacter sp.]|nr:ABC transporter permease [Candidatus Sulfopaludibacter sp.]